MKKLLTIFILLATMICCKKEEDPAPSGNPTNTFPNKAGYEWTYFVKDTIWNYSPDTAYTTYDTLVVTVLSKALYNGTQPAKLWEYKYNSGWADTFYVVENKDTISFYHYDGNTSYGTATYAFPLIPDNGWGSGFDTSWVQEYGTVTSSSGASTSAFLVKRNYSTWNYGLRSNRWFKNNVGFIKMVDDYWAWFPSTHIKTSELISRNF